MGSDKHDHACHPDQCQRRRSGTLRPHKVGTVANVLTTPEASRWHREGAGGRQGPRPDRQLHRPRGFLRSLGDALAGPAEDPVEIEALSRSVVSEFVSYVKLNKKISPEVCRAAGQIDDYSKLADTVAFSTVDQDHRKAGNCWKPSALKQRLEKALGFMEGEISVLQVEKAHPLARQASDGEDPSANIT